MTIVEYQDKLAEIERDYYKAKKLLQRNFALSNAKFKIGDIIGDERFAFKVEGISVSMLNAYVPEPVYYGLQLKRDMTVRKDRKKVCIYGNTATLIKKGE